MSVRNRKMTKAEFRQVQETFIKFMQDVLSHQNRNQECFIEEVKDAFHNLDDVFKASMNDFSIHESVLGCVKQYSYEIAELLKLDVDDSGDEDSSDFFEKVLDKEETLESLGDLSSIMNDIREIVRDEFKKEFEKTLKNK